MKIIFDQQVFLLFFYLLIEYFVRSECESCNCNCLLLKEVRMRSFFTLVIQGKFLLFPKNPYKFHPTQKKIIKLFHHDQENTAHFYYSNIPHYDYVCVQTHLKILGHVLSYPNSRNLKHENRTFLSIVQVKNV